METNQSIPEETQASKKTALSLPAAIVVAAVIIAGALFMRNGASSAETKSSPDKLDLISEVSSADFIRGNVDAPVTIIEYADFSCGFCGVYHPTLSQIVAESEGRVRWVYRHLPIFNIDAAVAGQCVGNTAGDKAFFDFADIMYANKEKYSAAFYREIAVSVGTDGASYDACIDNPLIKSKIQKEFSQAKILLGFNATPHTIIIDKDGEKFSFAGALPYEDVKNVVETLVQK